MIKYYCSLCGNTIDNEIESFICDVLDDNGKIKDYTALCPKRMERIENNDTCGGRLMKMKAWKVNVKDDFCSVVVFAPTRGIAKSVALSADILPDPEYLFLEAIRYPIADSRYNGNEEPYCMSWENLEDRLFLVKECGWTCEDFLLECCEDCSAKDYCGQYQQWLDDNEEE